MTFHHVSWVMRHSPTRGVQRLTLLVLAHHANDLDEAYPSITTITREACVSRRGAQNALRNLEDEGWIANRGSHPDPRYKGATVYVLPDPEGGAASAPAQSTTPGGAQSTTPGGGAASAPAQSTTPGGAQSTTSEGVVDCAQKEVVKKKEGKENDQRPTASQMEREAIDRIWAYWLQISSKRQALDEKRTRIIRGALRLGYSEEDVRRALLGLARSPFHNGQNEQHRSYLEIRYALKGRGDESDDERIEKAITWSVVYGGQQHFTDPAKVERWLDEVRYTLSQDYRPERARGEMAYRKLVAAGFKVQRLDGPPWARLSR